MTISRNGTRPTQKAPAEHFTGTVRLDPLFQSSAPARVGAAYVTFEPCARSDWHTHPLGQTLIVTFGFGLHQRWGGPVEQIRPGDVVTVGLAESPPRTSSASSHRKKRSEEDATMKKRVLGKSGLEGGASQLRRTCSRWL